MRRHILLIAALLLVAPTASADPHPGVTWPWLATQLVPSPEIAAGDSGAHFGLRWQVTPLLYSFGVYRGVPPWRAFVVEPIVRQSGSVELYFTPEYLAVAPAFRDRLLARVGVRSYLPLIQRGDYLSMSLGSSYFRVAGKNGASYELGAYVLYGVVGVQLTWSPGWDDAAYVATFRIRYF